MFTGINKKAVNQFQSIKVQIVREWEDKVLISPSNPFRNKIIKNAETVYYLIKESLCQKDAVTENTIRDFARTFAKQLVRADESLGNFVYNVNLGRSIIQKHVYKMELNWMEMQDILKKINSFFDLFLYYSVSHFSDVKNQIIQEKNQLIDMIHKDRLTILGQMTSSLIHEFRNPLTSIRGFIQLLKTEHHNIKYLDIISIELEQLNFRLSQFLLLSKKELIGKEKVTFSLNDLIEEVLLFFYPSISDGKVEIKKNMKKEIYINGYADEIRQMLINILFNAIDVLIPLTKNPLIDINCRYLNDTHIKLDIANNGPKIPEDIVHSIFEPFVTTKTLSSGLGLFVCKEIIEKHKGYLACETNEEMTIFSITLPVTAEKRA